MWPAILPVFYFWLNDFYLNPFNSFFLHYELGEGELLKDIFASCFENQPNEVFENFEKTIRRSPWK